MPKGLIAGAAGVVALGIVWAATAAIVPMFTDPQQNLTRNAKRMMTGPANAEDAKVIRKEFEAATAAYLEKIGGTSTSSNELMNKLQKLLPTSAFEVHVVELPRGLKIVEVDALLQAKGYLVMKNDRQVKVFPLNGLEVFDDARLLNESAGPLLVLLGHDGGQPPHRPQVKAYALMPDSVSDVTDRFVPKVFGEGTARFGKNNKDIELDLSLLSVGESDGSFHKGSQLDTTAMHQRLIWKDAHYVSSNSFEPSPLVTLYSVAQCLRNPELIPSYRNYLGPKGIAFVDTHKANNAGNFTLSRGSRGAGAASYNIVGESGGYKLDLIRDQGIWTVAGFSTLNNEAAQESAEEPIDDEEKPATASAPVVEKTPVKAATPVQVPIPQKRIISSTPATAPTERAPLPIRTPGTAPLSQQKPLSERAPLSVRGSKATEESPRETSQPGEISSSISAATVNIRLAPGTDAKPLAEVPKGSTVQIVGKEGGWYKVRHNGKLGYVYAGLVDYKKPDGYTTATITRATTATDQGKNSVTKPQAGDRVVVLGGLRNDKYKVQFPDGKTGFVNKDAVNVNIDAPQFVP